MSTLLLTHTMLEIKMVMILKSISRCFVCFCFSIRATGNKNCRTINCRCVRLQRAYPAARTDLLDILCTSRYLNKLGMRSAYVQNTDTNLRRSPDSSVVAVAVLGRSMAVWGPFAATWPWKITSV